MRVKASRLITVAIGLSVLVTTDQTAGARSVIPNSSGGAQAVVAARRPETGVLRNADVINLLGSNVSESVILDIVGKSQSRFDVGPAGMAGLVNANVPDAVIKAMVEAARRQAAQRVEQGFLENTDVLKLLGSNLSLAAILDIIRRSSSRFDVGPAGMAELISADVPNIVIQAMIEAPGESAKPRGAGPTAVEARIPAIQRTSPARTKATTRPQRPVPAKPAPGPVVQDASSMILGRYGLFIPSEAAFKDIYPGNNFVYGGEARIAGPRLGGRRLLFWAEGNYRARDGKLSYTLESTKVNVTAAEGGALYRFLKGKASPYVGFGVGYYMLAETQTGLTAPWGKAKQSKVGFCGVGGASTTFGRLVLDVRLKYSSVSMQPADFPIKVGGITIDGGIGLRTIRRIKAAPTRLPLATLTQPPFSDARVSTARVQNTVAHFVVLYWIQIVSFILLPVLY